MKVLLLALLVASAVAEPQKTSAKLQFSPTDSQVYSSGEVITPIRRDQTILTVGNRPQSYGSRDYQTAWLNGQQIQNVNGQWQYMTSGALVPVSYHNQIVYTSPLVYGSRGLTGQIAYVDGNQVQQDSYGRWVYVNSGVAVPSSLLTRLQYSSPLSYGVGSLGPIAYLADGQQIRQNVNGQWVYVVSGAMVPSYKLTQLQYTSPLVYGTTQGTYGQVAYLADGQQVRQNSNGQWVYVVSGALVPSYKLTQLQYSSGLYGARPVVAGIIPSTYDVASYPGSYVTGARVIPAPRPYYPSVRAPVVPVSPVAGVTDTQFYSKTNTRRIAQPFYQSSTEYQSAADSAPESEKEWKK